MRTARQIADSLASKAHQGASLGVVANSPTRYWAESANSLATANVLARASATAASQERARALQMAMRGLFAAWRRKRRTI